MMKNIYILFFIQMNITKIEDLNNIPEGITELDISRLGLTTLPILPQGLTYLNCSSNKLTSLDNLPSGLTVLYCSRNQLTSLDIANCDKLKHIFYSYNNFPEEIAIILADKDLTIQEKINKLIEGCLIPYDNSFVLK